MPGQDSLKVTVEAEGSSARKVSAALAIAHDQPDRIAAMAASLERIEAALAALSSRLDVVSKQEVEVMLDLTNLAASVEKINGVIPSAVATIQGLADEVRALKNQVTDPAAQAALDEFANKLAAGADTVAASIAANPVEAPPPTP